MNDSFVKLPRNLLLWQVWQDKQAFVVFVYLLTSANYEANAWHGVSIERGQCLTSLGKIASATGLSIRNVRTALSKLEEWHEVSIYATRSYSIVTICKYEAYNGHAHEASAKSSVQEGKGERQVTASEFVTRWNQSGGDLYGNTISSQTTLRYFDRLRLTTANVDTFIKYCRTPAREEAFQKWRYIDRDKSKPNTDTARIQYHLMEAYYSRQAYGLQLCR